MNTTKKGLRALLAAVLALSLAMGGCAQAQPEATQSETEVTAAKAADGFAGGSGTAEDPYQIAAAQQLDMVRNDLHASYVLTTDIDLSEMENWAPIGSFVPTQDSATGEDPDPSYAFTGTFDGNGYTIRGLKIDNSFATVGPIMGTGLFGVVMGYSEDTVAEIKNLVMEDVNISGFCLVGSAAGLLGGNSRVDHVELAGTKNEINGCEGVGGVVGTGADAENYIISNCKVSNAAIQVDPVDLSSYGMDSYPAACAGAVVGGLTGGELENCTAADSSIVANGPDAYALGGIVGAPYATGRITNCDTENVTIQAEGANLTYVGGIAGGAGTYEDSQCAEITDCDAKNIQLLLSDNAAFAGGVVGGGKEQTHADASSALGRFLLENCTASGTITAANCSAIGTLVGRSYLSVISSCSGEVTVNGTSADTLGEDAALTAVAGTYQGLFAPTTFKPEYDSLWADYCTAVVGTEAGAEMAAMMKASVGGTIYGQEAVDAYSANPEDMKFCCEYIGGLITLTFDGAAISGTDKSGAELFSHAYEYAGIAAIGADEGISGFNGYIYQSLDENSGEFSYFILMPDTPASTHHLELRYGSDLDELKKYASGEYAYWLAAGFPVDAPESEVEAVIALFCTENMDYTAARSESTLSAIDGFVGTWDADLSSFGESYEGVALYTVIDENGNGETFVNDAQTRTYMAYAYDNDGREDAYSGVYVAYDVETGEAEACKYVLENDGNKLSFHDMAGNEMISYTKQS